jgi:hypothetical protein
MPSKAKPKAAKRPSRAVGEKPAATKPRIFDFRFFESARTSNEPSVRAHELGTMLVDEGPRMRAGGGPGGFMDAELFGGTRQMCGDAKPHNVRCLQLSNKALAAEPMVAYNRRRSLEILSIEFPNTTCYGNPGQRMEHIAKELGVAIHELIYRSRSFWPMASTASRARNGPRSTIQLAVSHKRLRQPLIPEHTVRRTESKLKNRCIDLLHQEIRGLRKRYRIQDFQD